MSRKILSIGEDINMSLMDSVKSKVVKKTIDNKKSELKEWASTHKVEVYILESVLGAAALGTLFHLYKMREIKEASVTNNTYIYKF